MNPAAVLFHKIRDLTIPTCSGKGFLGLHPYLRNYGQGMAWGESVFFKAAAPGRLTELQGTAHPWVQEQHK